MTQVDIDLIAAAIRATLVAIERNPGEIRRSGQRRGVRRVAAHLADAIHERDPAFDMVAFLGSCFEGSVK